MYTYCGGINHMEFFVVHIDRYADVARSHFGRCALDQIPDRYREVGVTSEMDDSIVRPNLDTHVFVYPLEDIGPIAITPEYVNSNEYECYFHEMTL
jgi:hypothetical protein